MAPTRLTGGAAEFAAGTVAPLWHVGALRDALHGLTREVLALSAGVGVGVGVGVVAVAQNPLLTRGHRYREVPAELLVDRVVVTGGDVKIYYLNPATSADEHIRLSRLRTDYSHRLPRRPFLGQKALRAAHAKLIEDRVEDRAQRVDVWTPDGRRGRQGRLKQRALAVGEVSGVEEKLSVPAPVHPAPLPA